VRETIAIRTLAFIPKDENAKNKKNKNEKKSCSSAFVSSHWLFKFLLSLWSLWSLWPLFFKLLTGELSFVDRAAMNPTTLNVGNKLVVTCFSRSEEPTVRYFVVREFDAKVLRSSKSKGLNEQAIRASIRQVILDHKLKSEPATKSEIQILKHEGLIGKRAPSCALLSGSDMIKLLLAFDKISEARELKAAIIRSVKADPATAETTPDLPDIEAFLEQEGMSKVSSAFSSSSTSANTSPQKHSKPYRKRKAAEPKLDFQDSVEGKRERKRTAKAQALENGSGAWNVDEEDEDYVFYPQDSQTREISHILANIPRSKSSLDILSDTLCALHEHEISAKSSFSSLPTISLSTDPERKYSHASQPQSPSSRSPLPCKNRFLF